MKTIIKENMKKTIYYLNKEGRRIMGKEKFITYGDETVPENLVDHIETQEIKTTFQIGDIVEIKDRETSLSCETTYDVISEVDLRKGTIRLKRNHLKFSIEDGSCKSNGCSERIEKVSDPKTIEEVKGQIEKSDLIDEISWKLEGWILYEMSIEELTEIKKIIKKHVKE
jgi:hypothetical protein